MCETGRHIELPRTLVAQFNTVPVAEALRIRTQIDSDVENPAVDHGNDLGLRMLDLKMQAAQHAVK